jgi:tetratricopeptide (TPR) repeat protein
VIASQNQPIVKKIGVSCVAIFFVLQIALLNNRNLIYRSNSLLWEDTLKKSPGKIRALHNLSHIYLAEKNYTKAFIALRSLADSKASPHYIAYAHSNLGAIYLQWGDYSKAENEFKFGIKAKPTLPTNHFNLGTLLASQGRNLEAKKSYEKAEDLYKNYKWGYQIPAELYINKARLLLRLRLYDEAERSINDYLTIVKIPFILLEQDRISGSGPGYFILANIYSATGRLEKALYKYSQVGGKSELKAEAHNNRALIFIKKKSFKQAFEELNQAIIISPNLVDAHYNLGNLLIKTNGDSTKARKHLEKALKLITSQEGANRIKSVLKTLP